MRVLFLGNHSVGLRTLEAAAECAEVVGVVAHPYDPEDGVAYASVGEWASRRGLPLLRARGREASVLAFARTLAPDLLLLADYRYLLPRELIECAPLGAVNLHPSLLPAYRGRAAINWAILRGERELGLTAHFVDEGMDSGAVIAQERYEIGPEQDVGDALERLYPLYPALTRRVLGYFESGRVPRAAQDHARASAFPSRKPADGCIDWAGAAEDVHRLVRAVARPYPGAFTPHAGRLLRIWKARVLVGFAGAPAGRVLACEAGRLLIACGRGALEAREWESEAGARLAPGTLLGLRRCAA